ncbi:MAG: D-alanyl-D-alanine carboxypeptidase/D-alanyl-D-alanine-endopeptidase [Planctomycetota bacterium]
MKRLILLLLVFFAARTAPAQEPSSAPALQQELQALVAPLEREGDIRVGVEVETLEGQVIFSHRPRSAFVLASNTKLLTTGAALLALPFDRRWTTRVVRRGDVWWIVGSGDPSFRTLAGVSWPDRFLDRLARKLKRAGVPRLETVVLDDRIFDRQFRNPHWPADQWQASYSAPVSGLALEGNCLTIQGGTGRTVKVLPALLPPFPLDIQWNGQKGVHRFAAWWREAGPAAQAQPPLVVRGRLLHDHEVVLSDPDPLEVFRRFLAAGLAARGIETGAFRRAEAGDPVPEGDLFLDFPSAWTLAEAVTVANKDSDNFVTEMIFKTLAVERGLPGSFEGGTRAALDVLARAGLDPEDYRLEDGSGLARNADGTGNQANPAGMCALLRRLAEVPVGRILFDSLPIGGLEGRLQGRFRSERFQPGRVHAKTGWIRGASSLSGYLLAPDQTILAFSILVNYHWDGTPRTNNSRFKLFQEELLGTLLDRWPHP